MQATKKNSRELIKCSTVCSANRQGETTSPQAVLCRVSHIPTIPWLSSTFSFQSIFRYPFFHIHSSNSSPSFVIHSFISILPVNLSCFRRSCCLQLILRSFEHYFKPEICVVTVTLKESIIIILTCPNSPVFQICRNRSHLPCLAAPIHPP